MLFSITSTNTNQNFPHNPNTFAQCCWLVLYGMYRVDRGLVDIVAVQHLAAWFCEKAVVVMIKLL